MAKVRLDLLVSEQAKRRLLSMASKSGYSMSQVIEGLIVNGSFDGDVTFNDLVGRVSDLEHQLNYHIMKGGHE